MEQSEVLQWYVLGALCTILFAFRYINYKFPNPCAGKGEEFYKWTMVTMIWPVGIPLVILFKALECIGSFIRLLASVRLW